MKAFFLFSLITRGSGTAVSPIGRASILIGTSLILVSLIAILASLGQYVPGWLGPVNKATPLYIIVVYTTIITATAITFISATFTWWIITGCLCSSRTGFLTRPPQEIPGADGPVAICPNKKDDPIGFIRYSAFRKKRRIPLKEHLCYFQNALAFSHRLYLDNLTSYRPIIGLFGQISLQVYYAYNVSLHYMLTDTLVGRFILGWCLVDLYGVSQHVFGRCVMLVYFFNTALVFIFVQFPSYRARLIGVIGYRTYYEQIGINPGVSRLVGTAGGSTSGTNTTSHLVTGGGFLAAALIADHERMLGVRHEISHGTLENLRSHGYSEGQALRAREVSEATHRQLHPSMLERIYDKFDPGYAALNQRAAESLSVDLQTHPLPTAVGLLTPAPEVVPVVSAAVSAASADTGVVKMITFASSGLPKAKELPWHSQMLAVIFPQWYPDND